MERMRGRQGRPRLARRPPGELTSRWRQAQRATGDNPPGTFYLERDFFAPKRQPRPWEEVDFARWCFMEAGMTYDEADAEVRAVTTLLRSRPLAPAQESRSVAREPGAPDARRKAA